MRTYTRIISTLVVWGMVHSTAHAQSFVTDAFNNAVEAVQNGIDLIWPDEVAPEEVNARLGFGIGLTPDYTGSDNYRLRVVPLVDIRYKEAWRLNGSLLTFSALQKGSIEAGPLLALRFGRSENNNAVLAGLGDISTTLEVGTFVRYKTDMAILSAEYRHGLGAGIGSSVRLTAGHGIYKNGDFVAMLIGRAKWLSDKSMQTNFGVSETQSANSAFGLPVYITDSGFSELNASLVGAYKVSEQLRVLMLLSYGHLVGDARNSPIVTNSRGSQSQVLTGAGLAFSF